MGRLLTHGDRLTGDPAELAETLFELSDVAYSLAEQLSEGAE